MGSFQGNETDFGEFNDFETFNKWEIPEFEMLELIPLPDFEY